MARHLVTLAVIAVFALAAAAPAAAQATLIRGKVVTPDGTAVAGAKVVVEFKGGVNRRFESTTDRKGEFVQLLSDSGPYVITVTGDDLGTRSQDVQVQLGRAAEITVVLDAAAPAPDAGMTAALKAAFDAGVAASAAGRHDEAIARFTEAAGIAANCFDCYYNIGYAYLQKGDEKRAEENWTRALALKPDYAQALSGLATLYNNQKRFDEAAAMGERAATVAEAAGGGDAAAIYNQGIILWNQGKIVEARTKFEAAIAADPGAPDAYYQLGLALLNEGKTTEAVAAFERYLVLAPGGQFAEPAAQLVAQLKPH